MNPSSHFAELQEALLQRFSILPTTHSQLSDALWARQNSRTKPPGSLGMLEEIAHQAGLVFQSPAPFIKSPHIVVFAGDHGAAQSGISPYPQEVTVQMVLNYMAGGAAINVIARHNRLKITVVDAGVATDINPAKACEDVKFIDAKVAYGTRNYIHDAAMTVEQCKQAILDGAALVKNLAAEGCNTVGFGEMGIANTGSASLITHFLCQHPLASVVGRGAGHTEAGVQHKLKLLQQACDRVSGRTLSPLEVLAEFGGFEIAMMTGAYLSAAHERMLIVVDGVIATAGLLVAHTLFPDITDYCIFSHCSAEPAHHYQLDHLAAQPLVELGLCLGEGSGSALIYPIIDNALFLINEMAGFSDANVTSATVKL